jgi:hypothetical protein
MATGTERVDREIESERAREVEETVGKFSGVEEDREGSLVLVHNGTERGQGKVEVAAMVRAPSWHGRHAQATCRPLRHSVEHVSGDGLDRVEHDFGLLAGRIRPWAKNEVCCTRPDLQL